MNITFEFATQDDCLDKMLPSDLRKLVSQRDSALSQNAELVAYAADAERWFNKHDPNGYVSPKRELVKQHLRDRDAEVGRAGFVKGYSKGWNDYDDTYGFRREELADAHAEKVRSGEV